MQAARGLLQLEAAHAAWRQPGAHKRGMHFSLARFSLVGVPMWGAAQNCVLHTRSAASALNTHVIHASVFSSIRLPRAGMQMHAASPYCCNHPISKLLLRNICEVFHAV